MKITMMMMMMMMIKIKMIIIIIAFKGALRDVLNLLIEPQRYSGISGVLPYFIS